MRYVQVFTGPSREIWGPGAKFDLGALEILYCSSTKRLGGSGKILKSEVLEIAKYCTLSGYLSLFLLHTSFSFYVGPPLAGGPGQIAPLPPPPPPL